MIIQFKFNKTSITTIVVTYRYSELISNHNINVIQSNSFHTNSMNNLCLPHTMIITLTKISQLRLTRLCGTTRPCASHGLAHACVPCSCVLKTQTVSYTALAHARVNPAPYFFHTRSITCPCGPHGPPQARVALIDPFFFDKNCKISRFSIPT